jgi:hypothetical protein
MAFVQLDGNGAVMALFGGPQPAVSNCAEIDDADPRLAAFLTPPPPIQNTVTNFQCRAVLLLMPNPRGAGTMFDAVDTALKATGGAALMAWQYSPQFTRNSALLNQMAVQFSIPSSVLDTLFTQAAAIAP